MKKKKNLENVVIMKYRNIDEDSERDIQHSSRLLLYQYRISYCHNHITNVRHGQLLLWRWLTHLISVNITWDKFSDWTINILNANKIWGKFGSIANINWLKSLSIERNEFVHSDTLFGHQHPQMSLMRVRWVESI